MAMPMATWFTLSLGTAVLYGLHNVFTRAAAGRLPDAWGALILEGTAAAGILAFTLASPQRLAEVSGRGALFAALAGLCVGAGTVLFFMIFRLGGALSVAGPVVIAGGVAIMAVAGVALFGETITWTRALGLALTVGGLALLKA